MTRLTRVLKCEKMYLIDLHLQTRQIYVDAKISSKHIFSYSALRSAPIPAQNTELRLRSHRHVLSWTVMSYRWFRDPLTIPDCDGL